MNNVTAKVKANRGFLSVLVFSVLATGSLMHMIDHDHAERQAVSVAKWNKWSAYRDSSCIATNKEFGIPMKAFGFHVLPRHDSVTTYQCQDGIKYTVFNSIEHKIKTESKVDDDLIPEIK